MPYQQKKQYDDMAEILKAIAHPVRLCILKNLVDAKRNGTPIDNVTQIQSCVSIPQSTLSQHLQKMKSAGVIHGERKGLEISYTINDPRIEELLDILIKG